MIGYTQQADSPGLNAAVNGSSADEHDPQFLRLRLIASRVSVKMSTALVENIRVQVGQGIIRLELDGHQEGDSGNSPLALVATINEVRHHVDEANSNAVETAKVLDRIVNPVSIQAAFTYALKSHTRKVLKWLIPTAMIAVAIAVFILIEFTS